MAKLKLGAIADDKPVKLTVELPGAVHRDLLAYAKALAREIGEERVLNRAKKFSETRREASDPRPAMAFVAPWSHSVAHVSTRRRCRRIQRGAICFLRVHARTPKGSSRLASLR
jgi:hypothetical protein